MTLTTLERLVVPSVTDATQTSLLLRGRSASSESLNSIAPTAKRNKTDVSTRPARPPLPRIDTGVPQLLPCSFKLANEAAPSERLPSIVCHLPDTPLSPPPDFPHRRPAASSWTEAKDLTATAMQKLSGKGKNLTGTAMRMLKSVDPPSLPDSAFTSLPPTSIVQSAMGTAGPDMIISINPMLTIFESMDGLIDAATGALSIIWGDATSMGSNETLPISSFVKEIVRRSRSILSVLQLALFYVQKVRPAIHNAIHERQLQQENRKRVLAVSQTDSYPTPPTTPCGPIDRASQLRGSEALQRLSVAHSPLLCGRRTLLAAIMIASKYLLDKNYSNSAWSKMSGLTLREINANERSFLVAINYNLHIEAEVFQSWAIQLEEVPAEKAFSHLPERPVHPRLCVSRSHSEYQATEATQDIGHRPDPVERFRSRLPRTHSESELSARGFGKTAARPSLSRKEIWQTELTESPTSTYSALQSRTPVVPTRPSPSEAPSSICLTPSTARSESLARPRRGALTAHVNGAWLPDGLEPVYNW